MVTRDQFSALEAQVKHLGQSSSGFTEHMKLMTNLETQMDEYDPAHRSTIMAGFSSPSPVRKQLISDFMAEHFAEKGIVSIGTI